MYLNKKSLPRTKTDPAWKPALLAEGGSKHNGVRVQATDYEIYVSKYLLWWKKDPS